MSQWHGPQEPTRDRGFVAQAPSKPPTSSWWIVPRDQWADAVERETRERFANSKESMRAELNGQTRP